MQSPKDAEPGKADCTVEPTYAPPQVEAVMTAADLEREALYAGPAGYGTL